ncbi:MAG: hypothetical protein KIT48_01445 [Pseudolabrys sp.]|nr:hypothetical protein [Pseudolabrys sp.]
MSTHRCSDREALLRAASTLDLLAIGWRPGRSELIEARYLERWLVMPGPAGRPYQIIGAIWSLPLRRAMIVASVLAIDPDAHWARIWDEWAVINDGISSVPAFDPIDVQRAGAAWLLSELQTLPVR